MSISYLSVCSTWSRKFKKRVGRTVHGPRLCTEVQIIISPNYLGKEVSVSRVLNYLPRAALFSCLHLYNESPYFISLTQSLATLSQKETIILHCSAVIIHLYLLTDLRGDISSIFNRLQYMYITLTCQSNVSLCLFALMPVCSGPCHTIHSLDQHRTDGYPEKSRRATHD